MRVRCLILLSVLLAQMFTPSVEAGGQMKPTSELTLLKIVEAAYEVFTLTPAQPKVKVVPGSRKKRAKKITGATPLSTDAR